MKRIFYFVTCLLFICNCAVFAQDFPEKSVRKNEISVSTSKLGFEDLSLKYARLISNGLWFKVGVIDIEGSTHKNIPQVGGFISKSSRFNSGILIGVEKQKSINHLEFVYGLCAQMSYTYSKQTTENPSIPREQRIIDISTYTPGIVGNLGFFYKISPSFAVGLEINPSLNYSLENGEYSSTGYAYKNRDFYFSFTNNGALATLKYQF